MTTTEAPAVRIAGPAALAATLPHLVGFIPSESLVLCWFQQGGGLVLTERVNVEALDLPTADVVAMLPPSVIVECDTVAAVLWTDRDDLDALAEAVRVALDTGAPGLRVLDVLAVTEGGTRWRSLECADPECCPPEGSPLDAADPAAVEMIGRGSAPLATRDDLDAECVPAGLARTLPEYDAGQIEAWRDSTMTLWRVHLDPRAGEPDPEGARLLAASLADVRVRDAALWLATVEHGDDRAHLDLVARTVVRAAHPADAAPALTFAAIVAWQAGDGARANVRTGAALSVEPSYSLAHLIGASLSQGMPPQTWRAALEELGYDRCRYGDPSA